MTRAMPGRNDLGARDCPAAGPIFLAAGAA
jgi:hypothetical protein